MDQQRRTESPSTVVSQDSGRQSTSPLLAAVDAQAWGNSERQDALFGEGASDALRLDHRATKFPDVDEGAWYAPFVAELHEQGLINGYPNGEFRPEGAVNQAECLKILIQAIRGRSGLREAGDTENWYQPYLDEAANLHALVGDGEPDHRPTREDVAWMAWRLAGSPIVDTEHTFVDVPRRGDERSVAIYSLAGLGVVRGEGDGERFNPHADINRAQICKIAVLMQGAEPSAGWQPTEAADSVHARIAQAARAWPAGTSSGASLTGGTWHTDAHRNDGARMRGAVSAYLAGGDDVTIAAEFEGSDYGRAQISAFVARIRQVVPFGSAAPSTDQEVLTLLGVRSQCKEWVDRRVQSAGGTSRTYPEAPYGAVAAEDAEPGMGWYLRSEHSAIVVDVVKRADGPPTQVVVKEANYAHGEWSNPGGQVPWERTVGVRTVNIQDGRLVRFT